MITKDNFIYTYRDNDYNFYKYLLENYVVDKIKDTSFYLFYMNELSPYKSCGNNSYIFLDHQNKNSNITESVYYDEVCYINYCPKDIINGDYSNISFSCSNNSGITNYKNSFVYYTSPVELDSTLISLNSRNFVFDYSTNVCDFIELDSCSNPPVIETTTTTTTTTTTIVEQPSDDVINSTFSKEGYHMLFLIIVVILFVFITHTLRHLFGGGN